MAIELCGVKIDDLSLDAAVEYALCECPSPCFAVTPNAVMLDACRRDNSIAALLNRATLSLADGAGVVWAARKQKTPLLSGRVAGIEFGERLLEVASERVLRVFLLGGGAGVAEKAGEHLRERYPNLCICGSFWGYFQKKSLIQL